MKIRIMIILTSALLMLFAAPASAYQLFLGDIHSHTSFSDGSGLPEQAFDYCRDTGKADFLAVTDHVEQLGDRSDLPDGAPKQTEWDAIKSAAAAKTEQGRFIALAGFEWATDFTQGHINVLNTDEITSTQNGFPIKRFYTWLKKHPDALFGFNHPNEDSDKKKVFNDFSFVPELASQAIYVATNVPLDFPFYYKALDRGWWVAPSAQQDTHAPVWCNSKSGNFTGIYADSLTTSSLMGALRERRFFATNDRGLTVVFGVDGQPMGGRFSAESKELTIKISNKNGNPLTSVKLITNGGAVLKQWMPDKPEISEKFEVKASGASQWYVVLVETAGDRFAISAPVILAKQ